MDGKELAIYMNWNIKQTNIWGIGNEGYVTTSDVPNFYLKDHLGSIRIVTNENDEVISAQDFDAWGYLLEGREYESDESVYKFTGKERDEDNLYDYFGARYYGGRIANWMSVDPLMEKHFDFSPYNYVLRNPLKLVDPDGRQVLPMSQKPYMMEPGGDLPIGSLGVMLATAALIQSIFTKDESGELYYPNPIAEIPVSATLLDKGKLKGMKSQWKQIEDHLEKLSSLKPENPDPKNDRVVWTGHIIKAIFCPRQSLLRSPGTLTQKITEVLKVLNRFTID